MAIVSSVDQLNGYRDAIPFTADASFQNIPNIKRPADLAQVLGSFCAAICHHARAANYPQSFDSRQAGQDIVLDAVGKKRVRLVIAEIFERQNSNTFVRRTRREEDR